MARRFLYHDRQEAGIKLGNLLLRKRFENPFILGLPRGGVIPARAVARLLEAPVDVIISRKIGAPGHLELGIGAVSEDGVPFYAPEFRGLFPADSPDVNRIVENETMEMHRRIQLYREGKALPSLKDRTVIVVDDGLATGVTAIAAGRYLKKFNPSSLILAVPVAPDELPRELPETFDEILSPYFIANMMSIGMWYEEFQQVSDDEVLSILNRSSSFDSRFQDEL